jgi:hypothetical protein
LEKGKVKITRKREVVVKITRKREEVLCKCNGARLQLQVCIAAFGCVSAHHSLVARLAHWILCSGRELWEAGFASLFLFLFFQVLEVRQL